MRSLIWMVIIAVPLVLFFNLLERFGKEGVDRVEVAWQDGQQQRLSLAPGERQQVPLRDRPSFIVTGYWKDNAISRGSITDLGMGLTYHSASSAKQVDVSAPDRDHLSLFLVNVDLKTQQAQSIEFLRVARSGGVIHFAYPQ